MNIKQRVTNSPLVITAARSGGEDFRGKISTFQVSRVSKVDCGPELRSLLVIQAYFSLLPLWSAVFVSALKQPPYYCFWPSLAGARGGRQMVRNEMDML